MPDEPTAPEFEAARLIVIGAIAAAGKMESSVAWKGRVNSLIPQVASMLGDRSSQMQRALAMVRATVFTADYIGHDTEYLTREGRPDESRRVQVRLVHPIDRDHPDGVQLIRTERTDTQVGKSMLDRLSALEGGETLLCWRAKEEIRSGSQAGREASYLAHFEVLPKRGDQSSGSRGSATPTRTAPEGSPSPSGAPPEERSTIDWFGDFNQATEHMDGRTKSIFVGMLRDAGLWPPSADNIDRIILEVGQQ